MSNSFTNQDLRDELKLFYQGISPSPTFVEDLSKCAKNKSEKSNQAFINNLRLRYRLSTMVAATLVVLLFAGVIFLTPLSQLLYSPLNLDFLAARQIAKSHLKELEVEYIADSYKELSQQMNKLDFRLVASKQLESEMPLIGGRYCTLFGRTAAQLKLTCNKGDICTLFVTSIPEHSKSSSKIHFQTEIDGVNVKIWQEHGLIYGLGMGH